MLRENHRIHAFGLTLLLFAVSYLTVGWWTDSYQGFYDSMMSGEFTGFILPAADPFPEYLTGATHFFTWLNRLWPMKWVALMLNGLLFTAFYLIYLLILRRTEGMGWAGRIVLLVFFTALFVESVVLYHMVRITMFLGVAALSKVLFDESGNRDRWLPKGVWPYLLLWAVALWVRSSVHLFVMAFVTVVMLVHGRSLRPLMPFWAVFALFFANYVNIVFLTDHSGDLNAQFLYNHEFKLHHAGAYTPQLRLEDGLDSLKYRAVQADILGDEHHLNTAFYERIGAFEGFSRTGWSQLDYGWRMFTRSMAENMYFLYADLFLILSYLFLGGGALRHYRAKTLGLFIIFYLMVLGISLIKMENRFLVPFQVLFLMVIVLLHRPRLFYDRRWVWLAVLFLAAYLPITAGYTMGKVRLSEERHRSFVHAFRWLSDEFGGNSLVFNTAFLTMNRPHERFTEAEAFRDFYIYNYYAFQLSKTYRPFLEKECGCDAGDLHSFYDHLAQRPGEVIILDNVDRIPILEEYLSQVWGSHHRFVPMNVPDGVAADLATLSFKPGLSVFRLVPAHHAPTAVGDAAGLSGP